MSLRMADDVQKPQGGDAPEKPRRKRRPLWRRLLRAAFMAVLLLGLLLVLARPMMPWAIRWYVNRTLDKSQLYQGRIGPIELSLWRGAYAIRDIRIVKMTGNVPVPLFASPRVEFAMQWDALMNRKLVGRMRIASRTSGSLVSVSTSIV